MEIISGIYKIRNILDNKVYIGSAKNFKSRKATHFGRLKTNIHGNPHLQNAYNLYGLEYFVFEIIEFIENIENLIDKEQFYIDLYDATNPDKGYNIRKIASSNLGLVVSEETRKKKSLKQSGINNPFYGKQHTEESKNKMSESLKGRTTSEETKKKISDSNRGRISPMKGKKHTYETKQRMSKSSPRRPMSESNKKALSKSNKGRKNSKETNIKNSEWHKGRKMSEETKEKMSLSKKGHIYASKLTEENVLEIKEMIKNKIKLKDIAKIYNVSEPTISNIKTGRTWSSIFLKDDDENEGTILL